MKILPITSISIPPSRQRREFEAASLMRLTESITSLGLMHPIVIRQDADGANILVAGERRLRAISDMWDIGETLFFDVNADGEMQRIDNGFIPVVSMGELDEIQAMDAELSENIVRQDLTWQERAEALDRLNKLRLALNPDHSLQDMAREATGRSDGDYAAKTHRALVVAKHLDNPAVAAAKTLSDAYKILKREESTADFVKKTIAVGHTYGKHLHSALFGDCREWMVQLPEGKFDVICTDPPYGMRANEFGDAGGKLLGIDHNYKDDEDGFQKLLSTAIPLFGRVARPAAALYMFCDLDQFSWLRDQVRAAGWYCFRTPLIAVKPGSGRVPLPDHGPRRQYETILFAFRGDKRTNFIASDVISTRADDQMGHGAQKPVALYRDLLARHCRPGDAVFDPFAGTGTIFPAAHELKLIATGVEQSESSFGMMVKRLEGMT